VQEEGIAWLVLLATDTATGEMGSTSLDRYAKLLEVVSTNVGQVLKETILDVFGSSLSAQQLRIEILGLPTGNGSFPTGQDFYNLKAQFDIPLGIPVEWKGSTILLVMLNSTQIVLFVGVRTATFLRCTTNVREIVRYPR
jgi:hypothetical protein